MAKVEDFTPEFFRKNGIDTVQIAVDTLHCNARCEFCYLPPALKMENGDPGVPLYLNKKYSELMSAFVVGFANSRKEEELPMEAVEFIGGEVTMYPHNLLLLKEWATEAPKIRFHFVTNGVFFRKNWSDFALKTNSEVNFSLNAFDVASHQDRMKMGPVFNTVVENLRYYASRTKHQVHVSFVLSPKTVKQRYYSKIAEFAKKEFFDKGLNNIFIEFAINLNPQSLSEEGTFGEDVFVKDEDMIKDFLEHELPILLDLDMICNDIDIFRIMRYMKSSEEQVDYALKKWKEYLAKKLARDEEKFGTRNTQESEMIRGDFLTYKKQLEKDEQEKREQYLESLKTFVLREFE
jgi:MoaA/NifB/PqqE/SkfB family radical SAM enzyme